MKNKEAVFVFMAHSIWPFILMYLARHLWLVSFPMKTTSLSCHCDISFCLFSGKWRCLCNYLDIAKSSSICSFITSRIFFLSSRYLLISKKSLIGMELISFDVDGQECDSLLMCFPRPVTTSAEECPHDYLRIYDGRDESSPVIATVCGR